MMAAEATRPAGRFDHARRRKMKRSGDERGGWIYIPVELLDVMGFGGPGPAPFYRVWGSPRGRGTVQLYRSA
jgi:hypothetical protein